MTKTSVLIPAYNRAYIIREALQSAFAQTFQDFEVLVIDDGSKDLTSQIMQEYHDPRLRYIRHEKNKGYSGACNTGFREAKGEYVSFLDSDDLWKPEKLSIEVGFLERHREVQAVFSDLEKEDGREMVPSFMRVTPYFSTMLAAKHYPSEIVFTQREMYLCLLREVPIKPTALTIRKEAVEHVGYFNESWPSGSDWEFLLRFSRVFRFGYIDQPLAVLRVQEDATHRVYETHDKTMVLNVLQTEIQRIQDQDDVEALSAARWGYCDLTKHLAWSYLAQGQKTAAAKTFRRGFRQTGELGLLARSFLAYSPKNLRVAIKQLCGKGGH
jgi:glycosyltransferase involved in cell wall biosynthesis